jgi:GTP-binding protein
MHRNKVVIIGRPNVGKSCLFNRLCGRKLALVEDTPGVTRDWQQGAGRIAELEFDLIDTAGLAGFEHEQLKSQIRDRTYSLIGDADLILFMVDADAGLMSSDHELAQSLRDHAHKTIVIANKCDRNQAERQYMDCYALGFERVLPFSATHGLGLTDLYDALKEAFAPKDAALRSLSDELEDEAPQSPLRHPEPPLLITVVGRPNVGKSTFINYILGEERLLTGDEPGVTRDSITIDWQFEGRALRLVDTAGLRKKARINEKLEYISTQDTLESIRFAQVVVLMIDANHPFEKQDLIIAQQVVEEGRALVIALNKSDQVSAERMEQLRTHVDLILPQIKGVSCVGVSAKTGRHVPAVLRACLRAYKSWNLRISTGQLNRWLLHTLEAHPPPLAGRTRIRIKYVTQVKTRPPTFALFVTKPVDLPESYTRYLANDLRNTFNFEGSPLRLIVRKGKNPYVDSNNS